MRYDLNLLPIFVALMEERSVTRAAERMGMTLSLIHISEPTRPY